MAKPTIIEATELLVRTKRETPEYNTDFSLRKTIEDAWYKTEAGYQKYKDMPEDEED